MYRYGDEATKIRMKEWDTQKAMNIYDSYGITMSSNRLNDPIGKYYGFHLEGGDGLFKPRDITSEEILQQHIDKSKQVQAQYEDYVKKELNLKMSAIMPSINARVISNIILGIQMSILTILISLKTFHL